MLYVSCRNLHLYPSTATNGPISNRVVAAGPWRHLVRRRKPEVRYVDRSQLPTGRAASRSGRKPRKKLAKTARNAAERRDDTGGS